MPTLVLPNVPARTRRRSRTRRDLLIIGGLTVAALTAPLLVPDGVDRLPPGSVEREVASRAYPGAWTLNDNPVGRVLLPGVRVTRVWPEPGHCGASEQAAEGRARDYRAEVRLHSLFAIPGPVVQIRCGGAAYSW